MSLSNSFKFLHLYLYLCLIMFIYLFVIIASTFYNWSAIIPAKPYIKYIVSLKHNRVRQSNRLEFSVIKEKRTEQKREIARPAYTMQHFHHLQKFVTKQHIFLQEKRGISK